MEKKIFTAWIILICVTLTSNLWALTVSEIEKLKKAGISDHTIALMLKEKTVETCALTVEDIIHLKQTGISEKTLQTIIKEGSFLKERGKKVYSTPTEVIHLSVEDIIHLKKAGVSDEVIREIVSSAKYPLSEERKKEIMNLLPNIIIEKSK